ncbi:MAG: DUF2384 domain-containing protein [Legionella sp.]|nr:DUF2384 domain-containing protein [Legionella sp.]
MILNNPRVQRERVLSKAICNLSQSYGFSGKELSEITGMSEASVSRLYQGKKLISAGSKEGEIAVLLIRIYRSLNAMVGNNHEKAKAWLNHSNHYFQNKPINALKSISGLVQVLNYLDAMRGKL